MLLTVGDALRHMTTPRFSRSCPVTYRASCRWCWPRARASSIWWKRCWRVGWRPGRPGAGEQRGDQDPWRFDGKYGKYMIQDLVTMIHDPWHTNDHDKFNLSYGKPGRWPGWSYPVIFVGLMMAMISFCLKLWLRLMGPHARPRPWLKLRDGDGEGLMMVN